MTILGEKVMWAINVMENIMQPFFDFHGEIINVFRAYLGVFGAFLGIGIVILFYAIMIYLLVELVAHREHITDWINGKVEDISLFLVYFLMRRGSTAAAVRRRINREERRKKRTFKMYDLKDGKLH